jgi:hypothetical protein
MTLWEVCGSTIDQKNPHLLCNSKTVTVFTKCVRCTLLWAGWNHPVFRLLRSVWVVSPICMRVSDLVTTLKVFTLVWSSHHLYSIKDYNIYKIRVFFKYILCSTGFCQTDGWKVSGKNCLGSAGIVVVAIRIWSVIGNKNGDAERTAENNS